MLGHDQAALRRRLDLRIVGKNPRSRHDHVRLQPQTGFVNLVPHRQRNARMILLAGRPSRQQVLIVDEEAAVFEDGRRINLVETGRQLDACFPLWLAVGPVVHRIDAEEFLRELIDRIHRAAHVGSGQHHRPPLHREGKRFSVRYIFRTHPLRQFRRLANQHRRGARTGLLCNLRPCPQHLRKIRRQVVRGPMDGPRLIRTHHDRQPRIERERTRNSGAARLRRRTGSEQDEKQSSCAARSWIAGLTRQ